MLKVAVALSSVALVLIAAFVVLPKLLLNVSGENKPPAPENVPIGALHAATGTPGSGVGARARRLDDFASLASQAGFAPLTPSSLPNGYQVYEQYERSGMNGQANEVILTYRKEPDLYLLIDERPGSPRTGSGREFGGGPGLPRPQNSQPSFAQVDVGTSKGTYFTGRFGPAGRAFGPTSDLEYRATQPHDLQFFRKTLEIVIEADLSDISKDQLIKIGDGLR